MSRGLGKVQLLIVGSLTRSRYRSILDLTRDVYNLHPHGRETEPQLHTRSQYETVRAAVHGLKRGGYVRLTDRANLRGEICWELTSLKPIIVGETAARLVII